MTISKDTYVSFHYTLKDSEGNFIDSSEGKAPLSYVHGNGMIIPGLEAALEGKTEKEKFQATVAPSDAYGEYNERLVLDIPREQFEEGTPIEIGMPFHASLPDGSPIIVRVKKISGDTITIDGNHELSGKTLVFDIEIVEVRESTEEERHPHTCGGCGGKGSCGGCGDNCNGESHCDGNCGEESHCNRNRTDGCDGECDCDGECGDKCKCH